MFYCFDSKSKCNTPAQFVTPTLCVIFSSEIHVLCSFVSVLICLQILKTNHSGYYFK